MVGVMVVAEAAGLAVLMEAATETVVATLVGWAEGRAGLANMVDAAAVADN